MAHLIDYKSRKIAFSSFIFVKNPLL